MGFDEFAADPGVFEVDGHTVVWDLAERRWRPAYWHRETIVPGRGADRDAVFAQCRSCGWL